MNPSLKSVNLLEVGVVWLQLILPYLFFLLTTVFFMIRISSLYYAKSLSCYSAYRKRITYNFSVLFFALVVIIFSAFRIIESNKGGIFVEHGQLLIYPGGTDAPQYKRFFEIAEENSLSMYLRRVGVEPLYNFSCWFFSHFFHNYNFFLVFYYVLYVFCLVKYCKMFKFSYKISDFLCLLCIMALFLQGYNTFRCTTAIFLSIFVLDRLLKDDFGHAIVYNIIICGIHLSALVLFIPIVGLGIYKKIVFHEKNKTFLYYIILLVFMIVVITVLMPKLIGSSHYAMYMNSEGAVSKVWILTYCFMIFQVYIRRRLFFLSEKNKKIFLISLCFIPIFILQTKYEIAYRFMLYSKPVIYLILHEISCLKTKNNLFKICNIVNDIIFIGILLTFSSVQIISVGLPYRNSLF